MKRIIFLAMAIANLLCLNAQMAKKSPEETVKFLADHVLSKTSYQLMNIETGEVFDESHDLEINANIKVKSKYADWNYKNGFMNIAMLRIGDYLGEEKYIQFVEKNYRFVNQHYDYFQKQFEDPSIKRPSLRQLYEFNYLDNCGTMGAALLEMMNRKSIETDRWNEIIERTANYILNKEFRLDDGTLCREYPRKEAVWADDLYMSVAFLARMAYYSRDEQYLDFAIKQVKNFTKYLRNDQIDVYHHAYFHHENIKNGAYWGRANGWVMMAQVELLSHLPENHPERDLLIEILERHIMGISRLQSQSGLWHQLLNKNDSFLEASCSAMFTYCIAKAVNNEWIDPSFSQVAWKGWQGLYSKITEDAQVKDICVGTHVEMNLPFYYNRPISVNDTHGLAATLLAGAEITKMSNTYGKRVNPRAF